MGVVLGYARRSLWKRALTIEGQREAIASYAGERGWCFDPARQLYAEVPSVTEQDLRDRAAGGVLLGRLARGDRLIVTSLDRLFHKVPDCAAVLGLWGRLGGEVHVVDLRGPVHGLSAAEMAWEMASVERVARSERAALSAARSRY